jgi:glycosyltransferase involved in cell wall biosynthesis
MRVLLVVSSSRLAGTERHVIELAAGLRAAGIDAEVVCEGGGEGLDETLARRDVPLHRLGQTGWGMAQAVPQLARLSLRFDVVHSHLTHATAVAVAATAISGRPVIETRHFIALAHEERGVLARRVGQARRRLLNRGLDLTIAPSEAVARGVDGETAVVPHGIALRPAPVRHRDAPWQPRFLLAGRLERDRRPAIGLVLDGFAAARLPGARLTIVGDGRARAELEAQAARLGIAEAADFTGWVDDVAPYLADADVFVAPTVEAFGLATVEAMAAALPVVAVAAGGVVELVEDGRTGLHAAADPASFARAMTRLAGDRDLALSFGAAGRRRAEAEFTAERMVERTVALYRRLTGRTGAGPKVLRAYHSAVVSDWRQRDRELRRHGVDLTLMAPRAWTEGSSKVELTTGDDNFVTASRTVGRHPALFLYNPIPLVRHMRRHRLDVVDAHEEPYSLAAAEIRWIARAFQPDARVTLYSAQNLAKRYPWPIRAIEAANLSAADAIYVCNSAAADVWRGKGFTGEIQYLALGVDIDRFAPRPVPEGDGDGSFTVGYAGRLTVEKGVDTLIQALAGLPDAELLVAGDGPEQPALEALAVRSGVRATFLGSVPFAELPSFYRRLDALVIPSRPAPGWLEQFCRVAVEGMASGVPVVASMSGALPEVVGDSGLLFPVDDVAALNAALRQLASDPEERLRLARLGRERSRQFTWVEVAAAHLALYEKVLCSSTS